MLNEEKNNEVEDWKSDRLKAIEKMYNYHATEDDQEVVPITLEVIHTWYLEGFPKLETLQEIFDIEDVYDMDIDFKVYPREKYVEPKVQPN